MVRILAFYDTLSMEMLPLYHVPPPAEGYGGIQQVTTSVQQADPLDE